MLHFYDFEVFAKLWTVVIINPQRHMETVIVNDREKLEKYYNEYKDEIFVGFNSNHYDQWIFRAILCGFNPKGLNDYIIRDGGNGYKYSDLFNRIELYDYDCFTDYGLKKLEGFMGEDIRECGIPFDYEGEFTQNMIDEVIEYNRNDVLMTMKVFKLRIADFNTHYDIINTFGLSKRSFSSTQSQLVAEVLGARKRKHDDEWNIRIPDTINLGKYQYIADWFLELREVREARWMEVVIAGIHHIVADGGLHGAPEKPIHCKCTIDEIMVLIDAGAMYPNIIVNYGLMSRNVSNKQAFKDILDTSTRLKNEGRKKERAPYKLVTNKGYGSMRYSGNDLYDPLHGRLICIFGQLLLIDLIEKIEHCCEVIQSNTDGILVKLKRSDLEHFKKTVSDWEQVVGLKMSYDEYEEIYQKDANNYIAIDYHAKTKRKGSYVKELNTLDYDLPIVNKAIVDCILKGVHPRETIMGCDELKEFQKLCTVNRKKFLCAMHNGEKLAERTLRIYASKRPEDGKVGRVKVEGGTVYKFADTSEHSFIWNASVNGVKCPDYLDKQWYVDLAVKRLKHFGVTP